MRRYATTAAAFCLAVLLCASGRAQRAEDLVKVSAWIAAPEGAGPPHLVVEADIELGWHIISTKPNQEGAKSTTIAVDRNPGLRSPLETKSFVAVTPPVVHERVGITRPTVPVEEHEGRAIWIAPLALAEGVDLETLKIEGGLSGQVCETSCIPFRNFRFTAVLDPNKKLPQPPLAASRGAPPAPGALDSEAATSVDDPNKEGLWGLVVFSILGAMISWIMPCVYPMIPITISFFGKVAEKKHAGKTAVAASYGVGIAGTFVVIGLIVGLLSWTATSDSARADISTAGNVIATNPWLNLAVGLLFIVFALSMFGLFTIQMPSWLIRRTDRAGRGAKSAHVGAILLGITFALASFTCTVPVVGYLLVAAASGTGAGLWRCTVGMLVYGAVFAAPFIALSMFPAALSRMPRAGGWMETVKVALGFLELGVALKFLWVPDLEWGIDLLTRPIVLALFAILGLATAGYFLGLLPVGHGPHPKPLRVGWGRWVAAGLMVLLMVPVGLSLANRPSYQARNLPWVAAIALETVLPPAPTGDELARAEGWFVDDYDAALQKASAENRPLFIDFTGIYCGNCRAMEQTVFPLANIKSRLEEMVRVRLYVDRDDEKSIEYARLQSTRYGLSSQPFYVILDPRDEKTLASDGGFIRAETFEALLKQGLEKFQAGRRVASR